MALSHGFNPFGLYSPPLAANSSYRRKPVSRKLDRSMADLPPIIPGAYFFLTSKGGFEYNPSLLVTLSGDALGR